MGALGQRGAKWRRKSGCFFSKEHNEVTVLCNGTDRHEIPAETSIGVLYRTLIKEFQKISLKELLPPNRHFSAVLTGVHLTRLQVMGYVSGLC